VVPFDPVALLVMLHAFYPIVTVENLAAARRDRPEYFAGGHLGGSKGEKLFLPDGRIFDLILAAGGPPAGRRWQVLDVTNDPGGEADPFALEEGPIVPMEEDAIIIPRAGPVFGPLVAGELSALEHDDGILAAAAQPAIEFTGAADLSDGYARTVERAAEAHGATAAALDGDPITDLLEAAADSGIVIEGTKHEYDEPEPPDVPEPDPGDRPDDPPKGPPEPI